MHWEECNNNIELTMNQKQCMARTVLLKNTAFSIKTDHQQVQLIQIALKICKTFFVLAEIKGFMLVMRPEAHVTQCFDGF